MSVLNLDSKAWAHSNQMINLNHSLKHDINTMAVKWMALIVQQSLAAGE